MFHFFTKSLGYFKILSYLCNTNIKKTQDMIDFILTVIDAIIFVILWVFRAVVCIIALFLVFKAMWWLTTILTNII